MTLGSFERPLGNIEFELYPNIVQIQLCEYAAQIRPPLWRDCRAEDRQFESEGTEGAKNTTITAAYDARQDVDYGH